MTLAVAFVLVATFSVGVMCVYLVAHPDYKCGLLGVIGLTLIAFGAATRFTVLAEGCFDGDAICQRTFVPPVTLFVWLGLACFLSCVVYRFQKRTRRAGGAFYDIA